MAFPTGVLRSHWFRVALLIPASLLSLGFFGLFRETLDPVQFMRAMEDFQSVCSRNPSQAFEQYVTLAIQDELAKRETVLCPVTESTQGWAYFMDTAVHTMAPIQGDTALVLFYNPYCDTALLTVWMVDKKRIAITDAELFMGDYIRRGGEPPFDPEPYWLSRGDIPALGLVNAVNDTVQAFQALFADSRNAVDLHRWDKKLGDVTDEETMFWNHAVVSLLFEENFLALEVLFNDDALQPVARRLESVLDQLARGNASAVLAEAAETSAENGAAVRATAPALWNSLAAASFVDSPDNALVFLAPEGNGDRFVSLLFAKNGGSPRLRRIDTVDFHAAYKISDK